MEVSELESLYQGFTSTEISLVFSNLLIVGMALAGVYFSSRAKKSGELREVSAHFKDIKKQQAELTKVTGDIKTTLKQTEITYQVKLEAYHEKTIEATDTVFTSLIELRDTVQDIAFVIDADTKTAFRQKLCAFRKAYDLNQIWLDQTVAGQISNFAKRFDLQANQFIRNENISETNKRLTNKRINLIMDQQEKFYDFIYKEVNQEIEDLVNQIATTLQAEIQQSV